MDKPLVPHQPPLKALSANATVPAAAKNPRSSGYVRPQYSANPLCEQTGGPRAATFQAISYAEMPSPDRPQFPQLPTKARTRRRKVPGEGDEIVASASFRTIHLISRIAAIWRGYFARRTLRTKQITDMWTNNKFVKIQCFVRRVKAQQLAARLREQRARRYVQITAVFNSEQSQQMAYRMGWQRKTLSDAADVIQKGFRYGQARRRAIEEGSELPVWLTCRKRKPFNNNKNRTTAEESDSAGTPLAIQDNTTQQREQQQQQRQETVGIISQTGAVVARGCNTVFASPNRKRHEVNGYDCGSPVTEDDVMTANAKSRRHAAYVDYMKSFQHDKVVMKHELLEAMDLDGCAAIIQRQYRCYRAKTDVSSRRTLQEYLGKHVSIVQRFVRCYFSGTWKDNIFAQVRANREAVNVRYQHEMVLSLSNMIKWNRKTYESAAITVQWGWRWSKAVAEGREVESSRSRAPFGLLGGTRSPGRFGRSSVCVATPKKSHVTSQEQKQQQNEEEEQQQGQQQTEEAPQQREEETAEQQEQGQEGEEATSEQQAEEENSKREEGETAETSRQEEAEEEAPAAAEPKTDDSGNADDAPQGNAPEQEREEEKKEEDGEEGEPKPADIQTEEEAAKEETANEPSATTEEETPKPQDDDVPKQQENETLQHEEATEQSQDEEKKE